MKVYFVRHGQSKGNVASIHQHKDTELSEYGLQQALSVAKRFKKISIDAIYASDYSRAAKTAEIIALANNRSVIHTKLLRELKRPTEIEGKSVHDESIFHIKEEIKKHSREKDWHYSDEENLFDFRERAQNFLNFISEKKHRSVVAVTHGMFLRMIVAVIMIGSEQDIDLYHAIASSLKLNNTGITVCEKQDTGWRIISWNDCTHLD